MRLLAFVPAVTSKSHEDLLPPPVRSAPVPSPILCGRPHLNQGKTLNDEVLCDVGREIVGAIRVVMPQADPVDIADRLTCHSYSHN